MTAPRRWSSILFVALLALSACQDAALAPSGADDRGTGDQTLSGDGSDDGMITQCFGTTCDFWYARSLAVQLWDRPGSAIKFAAEPIGSCFPKTVELDWDFFRHLPNWTTALCIGIGGFAGAEVLKGITRAAQNGECLHIQTSGDLKIAGAYSFRHVWSDNGPVCDAAEIEWQRSHSPPATAITDTGLRGYFNAVNPVRMHDSRTSLGKLQAGATRRIKVRGSGTGIPFSAVAVQLNLTATEPVGAGFLTVWQCDRSMPLASNVNYAAGQTVANSSITAVGSDDTVCVYTNQTTHIVFDVSGYYDSDGAGYVPLSPYRAYDARANGGSVLTNGTVFLGDQIAIGAKAVVLNATVTDGVGDGFLSIFPGYTPWPGTSTSNFVRGQTVAAASNVGINQESVGYHTNMPAHVILDVSGYFKTGLGARLAPVVPARLLDTRAWRYPTALLGGTIVGIPTQLSGTPRGTIASVVLNITAVAPQGPGYLTAYPCNRPGGVPQVSNVNFAGGEVAVPNLATVQVDASDAVCIYASTTTDVVVDVQGYYLY